MEGDWLGNPANIKGRGYCLILQPSRDNDRAIPFSKWRRRSLEVVVGSRKYLGYLSFKIV